MTYFRTNGISKNYGIIKVKLYSYIVGLIAYTYFWKSYILEKGDEIFVYVYDAHFHSFDDMYNDMCGMDTPVLCDKAHKETVQKSVSSNQ